MRGGKQFLAVFAADCTDERSLAERGPGDGVDTLHADLDAISSRPLECRQHASGHVAIYDPFGWPCQQDEDAIGLLDDLPRRDGERLQGRVEDIGMDRDPLEVEDILLPPRDGVEESERSTVWAGLRGCPDAVG